MQIPCCEALVAGDIVLCRGAVAQGKIHMAKQLTPGDVRRYQRQMTLPDWGETRASSPPKVPKCSL